MTRLKTHSRLRAPLWVALLLAVSPAISNLRAQTPLRINAGGASTTYTSPDGTQWLTDRYFSAADTLYTGDIIAGTTEQRVYATARAGLYGDFEYNIPAANGSYDLSLRFAEIKYYNKGERVFNVIVNGTKVLSNFDIIAEAGARTALVKNFPVTVSNGNLRIQFQGVVHYGIINGIVLSASIAQPVTVSVNPAQVSLTAGATQQFTAAVGGSTNTSVAWTASAGTITAGGLYTAPATIAQSGTATVTATSAADANVKATATVNLTTPIKVAVTPATGTVTSGLTLQLNAGVTGTSDTRVTWTASAGTVSSTGLFTAPPVTAPAVATVTATSVADTTSSGVAQITVNPPTATTNATFLESGGQVAMEAEHGTIVNRTQSWLPQTSPAGFSGTAFLSALPNNGVNNSTTFVGVSPEVQFRVNFATAGTYYIWVRAYSTGPADDSVNVGLDGAAVATGNTLSMFPAGSWAWSNQAMDNAGRRTLTVSVPGVHVVNVWMREDGFNFDKLLLTTDSSLTPLDLGPAESPMDAGSGAPALGVTSTNLSFSSTDGAVPAPQAVTVGNLAAGTTMNWTTASDMPWLTVSPASGSNAGTLTVSVNPAGLAAGNYSGNVTVSSAGATGSPQAVKVSLSVTQSAPAPPPPVVQPPATSGNQWHVSPNGSSSGDGSQAHPWDIYTAFNGPSAVKPGDTIWLHDGKYGNNTQISVKLAGTASAPIIVRGYPGERPIMIGGLGTYSPYVWYWGFEITSTGDNRYSASNPECFDTYDNSIGVKIINMILHDCSQGLGFWKQAVDAEAYGNIIYYNGYQLTDRGHGHGIYTQNGPTGKKYLTDNIIFDQMGLGIQAYGSGSTYVQDYFADGNIVFNNGSLSTGAIHVDNILFAGGQFLDRIVLTNNYTYHTPTLDDGYSRLGWQYQTHNGTVTATGNYWVGGESTIENWYWDNQTFTNNLIYGKDLQEMMLTTNSTQSTSNYNFGGNQYFGSGKFTFNSTKTDFAGWKSATGLDSTSTFSAGAPAGVNAFARPNKYESGRGNVVVYNWDKLNTVDVDVSNIIQSGARYEVRDVQNLFGAPVLTGTYNGGKISIPMTNMTKTAPLGQVPSIPPHTGVDFGVFVIFSK